MCQYIERGGRLKQPPACPDAVYTVIRQCWEYKASDRPQFKKLYEFFGGRKDPNYPLVPDQLMSAMELDVGGSHV